MKSPIATPKEIKLMNNKNYSFHPIHFQETSGLEKVPSGHPR